MGKVIEFLKSNLRIVIVLVILLAFFVYYISTGVSNRKTTYTVVTGEVEHSLQTNMYIIKNETKVDYDTSQAITAIVEQGARASSGEAIATYQNESYEEYQTQIAAIDKQIQTLVKDLPDTSSTEITNINQKILKYAKEIQGETSYLKIQEYKTKLDDLAYEKVTLLADSSPDNSAIRDLLSQREELVSLSKTSDSTIWAPMSGIVTYKLDLIEGILSYDTAESASVSELESFISTCDDNLGSEFGIKIVNNFEAYLLVKTATSSDDEYIVEGTSYTIRISDIENYTLKAELIKNITANGYNYSLFEINDYIDELVDYRKVSCEIVLDTTSGIAVPLNAIYEDEIQGYNYVLMVYGTEYIKIPISIVDQSDSIAIVENVEEELYEEYGLDSTYSLELYDELIIE